MLSILLSLLASYLLGSVPTAYIFGKAIKGVDIRTFGSGNVGATNAARLLGKRIGFLVLFLDVLKGFVAVAGASILVRTGLALSHPDIFLVLVGIVCIAGHSWTVFLQFKGGKGIATTLGVLIGLSVRLPGLGFVVLTLLLVWALVFALSRIVSLSSVIASACFPFALIVSSQSLFLVCASVLLSGLVIFRHLPNIRRLLQGTEKKFKFR